METPTFYNLVQPTASYVIFTDGDTIFALNGETGHIDYQGAYAAEVIQQTVARDRRVFVRRGVYPLTPLAGKGIDLVRNFTLELEMGTFLQVPNGYESYVFRFDGRSNEILNTFLIGSNIREDWTNKKPQRKWTAIQLLGSKNGGVSFNSIKDLVIQDADIAIKLQLDDPAGFVNGNEFKSLRIFRPNTFIEFDTEVIPKKKTKGFSRNYFENIMGQAREDDSIVLYGARNIKGTQNTFVHVNFYDLHRKAISANIHEDARNTIILGGIMTNRNFTDKGQGTQIIEQFSGASLKHLVADFIDQKTQQTLWRMFADEDGLYVKNARTNKIYRFILQEVDKV